jgi:predicted TIM-barrel fold metal-dependent hydrolase
MLIDIHAHTGLTSPGAASPASLAEYAQACHLDRVLISNRDAAVEPHEAANLDEADANLACLQACRDHPKLAALYWVRPGQVDSNVRAITGALKTAPFVGALFSPAAAAFDAADPILTPYLDALARTGRPAVFCVTADERAGPAKVYELARHQPGVPVVLCLCSDGASQRAAAVDVVGHARRRADANLYLDTSHVSASEIAAAIRVLGSECVLFGSDALSGGQRHATQVAALFDQMRNDLSPLDFQNVTGENAARLFGIGPAPE